MSIMEESSYQGKPMLVLKRNIADKFPFQFGLAKAKLILESHALIEAWVAKEEAKAKNPDSKY